MRDVRKEEIVRLLLESKHRRIRPSEETQERVEWLSWLSRSKAWKKKMKKSQNAPFSFEKWKQRRKRRLVIEN